jgi:hypothetical protein
MPATPHRQCLRPHAPSSGQGARGDGSFPKVQTVRNPDPQDLIDGWKLQVALARLRLTRKEAAARVGVTANRFYDLCVSGRTHPPAGFRAHVETALGLEPGALKF